VLKAWLLWSAAAVALAVAEVLTIGLFLVAFAVGAVLACLLAAVGVSFSISLAALVGAAALLLTSRRGFWLGGHSGSRSERQQPRSSVPAG
jgi:membrane protein implicated in regulation of membrane protease activity